MRATRAQFQIDARAINNNHSGQVNNIAVRNVASDSNGQLYRPSHDRRDRPRRESAAENQQKIQHENLALMRGVIRRDNEALKELFDRYSGYVFGVCLRVLGDRGDAEEVMIDTFWELWRKPERYDAERGSLVKYLVMMARSRAIDRSRTRANAKKMLSGAVPVDENFNAASAGSTPEMEPHEAMMRDEQQAEVAHLLQSLNGGQREAIELCFFHGLSHQQAADVLQQPLGTVKTRIRQGLIRMRSLLPTADRPVAA